MDISKRSLKVQNPTNYFVAGKDRVFNRFSSPHSYRSRCSKVKGYEARLYWQFRYCEDHNGQTFFYTLTYNNKSVPKYDGKNCFDYEDLVYLLNGGFKKQLLRKFGTNFKYFVGAELGDGKGKRGFSNNPHYHILFFLFPAEKAPFDYVKIQPAQFRHLVREYWQGFDQNFDGYKKFSEAKFGIAKEGDNLGLVTDFRACQYCAKYVTKDAALKRREKAVLYKLEEKFAYMKDLNDPRTKADFVENWLIPNTGLVITDFERFWQDNIFNEPAYDAINPFGDSVQYSNITTDLYYNYKCYANSRFDSTVRENFNAYRNRYSNKCRISNGVGDYALQFIEDKSNPTIKIPDKKDWQVLPLSQYYYRKLFTHVVKDENNQPLRLITYEGIDYKDSQLDNNIDKLKKKTASQLNLLDEDFFNKITSSELNCGEVLIDYKEYQSNFLAYGEERRNEIIRCYSIYKLVYEDRFFSIYNCRWSVLPTFDRLPYHSDYRRFLSPSYYLSRYCDTRVSAFLSKCCEGYLSYLAHPSFLWCSRYFALFDLLSDYLFITKDDKKEAEADESRRVKRFHEQQRFQFQFSIS